MKDEALKLALEALERCVATCFDQYAHEQVMSRPEHFVNQTITAIKEALAQPDQSTAGYCKKIEELIVERDSLRAALAQPVQEPVFKWRSVFQEMPAKNTHILFCFGVHIIEGSYTKDGWTSLAYGEAQPDFWAYFPPSPHHKRNQELYARPPMSEQETMFKVDVAKRKWESLQADGHEMEHIAFAKGASTGIIDAWGKVIWLEATPPLPVQEPYDQTALELCKVCGWKTLIPSDACLNCEKKAQPVQEDSCFCHDGASLQMVSGGAAPEGYLGRVTLLIDGEYVDYVKAQPQREWIGLTEQEYDGIWRKDLNNKDIMDKTITKLKKKNT